jgi:hypothetical protein
MRMMISLLIDNNVQNFDVIVIQKSWRNFFVLITLSFSQNDFHLFYKLEMNTKMCFYVNDKLNMNNWDVEYFTIDIYTLKIKINDLNDDTSTIYIHNMYNFSFVSYTSRDSSFTFSETRRCLIDAFMNYHILFEDFNLHHLFWNDSSKSTQHATTNELLNIIKKHDLTLILLKEIITWENRITINTIDLTFMTFYLIEKLKHCATKFDLDQSSNYISISICIFCDIELNSLRTSWKAWKMIDLEKIKEIEKNASFLSRSTSIRKIYEYVREIQKFL